MIQDNASAESWQAYPDWGATTNHTAHYHLTTDGLSTGTTDQATIQFNDQLDDEHFQQYAKNNAQWQRDLVKNRPRLKATVKFFRHPPKLMT